MAAVLDNIKKAKVSFEAEFLDTPTGGVWIGLPEQLKNILEDDNSFTRLITDCLVQDEKYKVTIKFEVIKSEK